MVITGAFLAAHAEIIDQKLHVRGGVLDYITVPRPDEDLVGVVYLVTLMQAGPDDHQTPYRMTLELVDPRGDSHTIADGPISVDAHHGENRFWITPIGLKARTPGRIVLVNTIVGGGSVSIPVEVRYDD